MRSLLGQGRSGAGQVLVLGGAARTCGEPSLPEICLGGVPLHCCLVTAGFVNARLQKLIIFIYLFAYLFFLDVV